MSHHPCSHEAEAPNTGLNKGRRGSDLPIVELDKKDRGAFKGRTPGDRYHRRSDHPLKIRRNTVKREEGDQGER